MKDNQTIGLRIAKMRQGKGMTQTQLAATLGVSHQAVSKWESGQALPDIATMLDLTHMFGITVEELVGEEENKAPETEDKKIETEGTATEEATNMNINELLQMAPYMSKEAVGEIAMKIEEKISAWQLAKLAPYVTKEVLEQLIEKHHPEMSWDTLKKLAPFMTREMVDNLAREISEGLRKIHPTQEEINKTIDDIGKTIDDIGKGVGKAFDDIGKGVEDTVKRMIRFGGTVINDMSEAFSDLANDIEASQAQKPRSERAQALRRRAFERALQDRRFDWIGDHMDEIEDDPELKNRIATEARKREMHDWICEYMKDYVDEQSVRSAIENGNWSFLGENVWEMDAETQAAVAMAAAEHENWEWLEAYGDQLTLGENGLEIARKAMKAGAKILAHQICETHLKQEDIDTLVMECFESGDMEGMQLTIGGASAETIGAIFMRLADAGAWDQVEANIASASDELKETLLEIAVEAGNFDAVDMIDSYL